MAEYFTKLRKKEEYVGSLDEFLHVQEVLQLMTYLTKDHRFKEIYDESCKEGVVIKNMSEVLDKIEARGKAEAKNAERARIAEDMLRDNEPIEKIRKYSKLADNVISEIAKKIGVAVIM